MHGKLYFILERLKTCQNTNSVSYTYVFLSYPLSEITLSVAAPLIELIHPKYATNGAGCVIHY